MRRSPHLRLLVCSFAAAIVAVVTFWWWRSAHPLFGLRQNQRVVEARVSVFGYAAPRTVRSGPSAFPDTDLVVELRRRMAEARTPENLLRVAVLELAAGRTRVARDLLAEASRLDPNNVAILSDLAAAEIALGQIAEAAEICGRALSRDPQNQPAAFNWALALERLSIRPVAIDAWEKFLTLDSESGWADEARQHLAKLRRPRPRYDEESRLLIAGADAATVERVVRRFPQRSRGRAQNYILPQWLESGDPRDLALMMNIAQVRARLGDPYLLDIVEHAVANRGAVTRALREFTAARAEEEKQRWDTASERFSRAASLLAQAGSPLAIGAAIYAAQGDFTSGRQEEALARLKRVEEDLAQTGQRYPTMAAESAWVRAMIVGRMGEPQQSLDAYRYALAEATRGGEIEHAAALAAMVAWMLDAVGDPAEADQYRLETLRHNEEINAAPERMYTSYLDASWVALRAGRPHLALAFVDAMTPIARNEGLPLHLAESEAWRALGLFEIGERDAAQTSIAAARAHAMRIPVDATRDFTLANIEYTAGRLNMPSRPAEAVMHFDSAVDLWRRHDWRFHMATALLACGEAKLVMRDEAAAESDFRAGVAEMEKQRTNLEDPSVRVAYFERSDRLFDRLIELLLDQGRTTDALSIVERKRARSLLDQIAVRGVATAAPLKGTDIAGAVRGSTSILEIALLDRGAELWLIRDGKVTRARSGARRNEIETAVARHLAAIAAADDIASRQTGRWLYDQFVAPVLPALEGTGYLMIVPEGDLQTFPFVTLVAGSGQYLVESYSVATAPSASVFLRSMTPQGDGLLAVAEPAPAGFERLPSAKREAFMIAREYKRARVLIGSEITPAEFLQAAGDAALVHFAGHAIADVSQPATSSLIFESSEGPPMRLTVEQIGRSTLPSHPLVVVAACSTARGKSRRTEGVDSLASAFLQAGARGVMATLWDVDDDASSRLFRSVHSELRAGARPSDALRNAQRSLLRSSNPRDRSPAVWGSVTLIGTL